MKIFGFIFTLVGVCFLGTFIYLCLPSDVGYSEVDNLYMNMSSKQSMAMMLPVYGSDKDDWKDKVGDAIGNDMKDGVLVYPLKGNSDAEWAVRANANVGYSPFYRNLHGGADLSTLKDGVPQGPESLDAVDSIVIAPVKGIVSSYGTYKGGTTHVTIKATDPAFKGLYFITMHLSKYSAAVKESFDNKTEIAAGTPLGQMDSEGTSTYNHCHFQVSLMDASSLGASTNFNPWTMSVVETIEKTFATEEEKTNAWAQGPSYQFDSSIDEAIIQIPDRGSRVTWETNPVLREWQIVENEDGHKPKVTIEDPDPRHP